MNEAVRTLCMTHRLLVASIVKLDGLTAKNMKYPNPQARDSGKTECLWVRNRNKRAKFLQSKKLNRPKSNRKELSGTLAFVASKRDVD